MAAWLQNVEKGERSKRVSPTDLRRERPAWGIEFADGARGYIDADTGSLLAIRSGHWRWFDFMWGLHIMALQTREDTSRPLLVGLAALALLGGGCGVSVAAKAAAVRWPSTNHSWEAMLPLLLRYRRGRMCRFPK